MSSAGIDVVKVLGRMAVNMWVTDLSVNIILVNAEKLSRRRWLSQPKYFEAAELYLQASGYFTENGQDFKC